MSDDLPSVESRVVLHGPYDSRRVTVDGRVVPFLEAIPVTGGKIDLELDSRYGLVLTIDEFERFVPFLADALAIGMGYTCHPRPDWDGPIRRPLFPRLTHIDLGSLKGAGA